MDWSFLSGIQMAPKLGGGDMGAPDLSFKTFELFEYNTSFITFVKRHVNIK